MEAVMKVKFESTKVESSGVQVAATVTDGPNSTRHLVVFPIGAVQSWIDRLGCDEDDAVAAMLCSHFPDAEGTPLTEPLLPKIRQEYQNYVSLQQAVRRDPGGVGGGSPTVDHSTQRRQ